MSLKTDNDHSSARLTVIGQRKERKNDMKIFCDNPGSCIEPGGYELAHDTISFNCRGCGIEIAGAREERVEGGSLNAYLVGTCPHCGADNEQTA